MLASRVPAFCRHLWMGARVAIVAAALGACAGVQPQGDFGTPVQPSTSAPEQPAAVGDGEIKIGLLLPMSASGNAGEAARAMKNAAEMALVEFKAPNIQLLVKDTGGTSGGAQQAAQQALGEGAQIIVGPLFAQSVRTVGSVARAAGKPVIAFSTDSSVAAPGVYLLSYLPEADVDRIVEYATSNGKRSFVALLPDNAYGTVVEGAFQQAVSRHGGNVVGLQKYPADPARRQSAVTAIAQSAKQADAIFIPDGQDAAGLAQALAAAGVNMRQVQLLGTGLWDDPSVSKNAALQGAWYAAPDPSGFRSFASRYRRRYGSDPVRTASLAYDAVTLVAALVKTQGAQSFSDSVLTASSGFAGTEGLFRFRADGTSERGLSIMRVSPSGAAPISPAPRAFGS
ncbi:MAG TPA: penicillin-binding protein activator [Xanthobacteraceae bacterium]|jgi:branched-chain amino acid transport system substrate-binding protein|nr:penicillin-binding protein activator [Xanthobacteraceae bacterium]